MTGEQRYFMDFALFCTKAPIAVETDGDTWHAMPERANQDYLRQNAIESIALQTWLTVPFFYYKLPIRN